MKRIIPFILAAAFLFTSGSALALDPALPDAPGPQPPATSTDAQTPASAPSLIAKAPDAPVGKLGLDGKFNFYLKSEFAPANLVLPAVGALYHMANPPTNYKYYVPVGATKPVRIDVYPRAWKDGGGAFGRNYGDGLAVAFSAKTAIFATGAILREDPRYFPSENRAFGARVLHALMFTLVDKADSGSNRIAISNFAGAAAGGFVGNAYLPPGYRDLTHAGQRSMIVLGGLGGANEAAEFRPEIRAVLRKLHVPFVK